MPSGTWSRVYYNLKNMKKINILILSLFLSFILFPSVCSAGPLVNGKAKTEAQMEGLQKQFDSSMTIGSVMATVIKIFTSLLGIIFLVLIVYAGYNWMTAGGDSAKIDKAKEIMQRAVIGLIIIVAAYSITYFVFKSLSSLSGTPGPG